MTAIASSRSWLKPGPVTVIKIGTIAVLLLAWQLIAVSGLLYQGLVPPPLAVGRALLGEIFGSVLYRDLAITLFTSFSGFVFGAALALLVGIWLGSSAFMRRAFEPYLLAIAGTPKIIFLPILFLVFGLGVESKIAKSAMSAFFPVVFSTISGYLQIRTILLRVGESFHLGWAQKVWMIYLPAMLPSLLVGLRLGLAMSIIGVLSAEIAYSDSGLGFRLMRYADQFQIPQMYATIFVIFALASLINAGFSHFQRSRLRYLERPSE